MSFDDEVEDVCRRGVEFVADNGDEKLRGVITSKTMLGAVELAWHGAERRGCGCKKSDFRSADVRFSVEGSTLNIFGLTGSA